MKRSPELRDLSEEHHYGLVAARSLRLAGEGAEPTSTAVEAFLAEWHGSIRPHFRSEEEVLLPQFAAVVGADHDLIVRTLTEHAELRVAVLQLAAAEGDAQRPAVARVAQLLHDHIRFEERVLFPAVEEHLSGSVLQRLGETLKCAAAARDTAGPTCRTLSGLLIEKPPFRMH